jgi:hypothetical protein
MVGELQCLPANAQLQTCIVEAREPCDPAVLAAQERPLWPEECVPKGTGVVVRHVLIGWTLMGSAAAASQRGVLVCRPCMIQLNYTVGSHPKGLCRRSSNGTDVMSSQL